MVDQYLPEHPFIRGGDFCNPVLGSVVLAHAVSADLLKDADPRRLLEASKQPFLWRSFRNQATGALIDGKYVGCVLASFWNDPLTDKPEVIIRSQQSQVATICVPRYCDKESSFEAVLPLTLEGQARECDVEIQDTVRLQGYSSRGSGGSAFHLHGTTTIIAQTVDVAADTVVFDGQIWLEADQVGGSDRIEIHIKNGTLVGWGGQFANRYPWNRTPSTLTPPYDVAGDALMQFIDGCWRRLPTARVLILNADFTVPEDDQYMRWAERCLGSTFPLVMRAIVEEGCASTERAEVSGSSKIRVHFKVGWGELRAGLRTPGAGTPEVQRLLTKLRQVLA